MQTKSIQILAVQNSHPAAAYGLSVSPLCGFWKILLGRRFLFMKKIIDMYKASLKELSVTRNVVFCGLMAALAIVLGMVASITVGPYIKIGFSVFPIVWWNSCSVRWQAVYSGARWIF